MASRPALGQPSADLPPEEQPVAELPTPPPAPLVIPRGIQLVLLLVALLGLWVAARAARHVVEIIVVASFIALVLNPFVEFLGRRGIPRSLAIPLAYISLLVVLAGIGVALAQPISNQIDAFQHNFPHLVNEANRRLDQVQTFFNHHGIHIQLRKQGHTALDTIQSKVLKSSSSILSFTTSLLKSAANAAIALVLIFVMSVYLLIYARQIGTLVRRWLPDGDGTVEDDYPTRVQRAVGSYIRGQLFFSVVMGTTAGVCLWVFGVSGVFPDGRTYAFAFGAFFGVMELVPFVGPILGAIPPVVDRPVREPADRVVGGAPVHRAPAAGGPRRRAADLQPRAAHQPAAGDRRPAVRVFDLRGDRRADGAAGRGGDPRDDPLPAPARRARALAHAGAATDLSEPPWRQRPVRRVRRARSTREPVGRGHSHSSPERTAWRPSRPARRAATIGAMPFPDTRLRRLRRTAALRDLVRETELGPQRLIAPLFVASEAAPIDLMPGVSRLTISGAVAAAGRLAGARRPRGAAVRDPRPQGCRGVGRLG